MLVIIFRPLREPDLISVVGQISKQYPVAFGHSHCFVELSSEFLVKLISSDVTHINVNIYYVISVVLDHLCFFVDYLNYHTNPKKLVFCFPVVQMWKLRHRGFN